MACRSCGVITSDCDWRITSLGPIFAPIDIDPSYSSIRPPQKWLNGPYMLNRSPR